MVRRGRRPHICTYHINLTRNRNGGPCSAAVSGPSIHGLLPVADDDLCFDCKGNYFPDTLSCKFCRFPENTRFFHRFHEKLPHFSGYIPFFNTIFTKTTLFFSAICLKNHFTVFSENSTHKGIRLFCFSYSERSCRRRTARTLPPHGGASAERCGRRSVILLTISCFNRQLFCNFTCPKQEKEHNTHTNL